MYLLFTSLTPLRKELKGDLKKTFAEFALYTDNMYTENKIFN
jgi:hypothetical protein